VRGAGQREDLITPQVPDEEVIRARRAGEGEGQPPAIRAEGQIGGDARRAFRRRRGAHRPARQVKQAQLRRAVDVDRVGQARSVRGGGQGFHVPLALDERRQRAGRQAQAGDVQEVRAVVGGDDQAAAVRRVGQRLVAGLAVVRRDPPRSPPDQIDLEHVAVERADVVRHGGAVAIRGEAAGEQVAGRIVLPDQPRRLARRLDVQVEQGRVAAVGSEEKGPAVHPPAVKEVHRPFVARRQGRFRPVGVKQVELDVLVAARVAAVDQALVARRGGELRRAQDAIRGESELIRPARAARPVRDVDRPDLRHAGDVGEEGHAPAIRRKGGHVGHARAEVTLDRVATVDGHQGVLLCRG